jgi:hypothetical protein
MLIPLLQVYPVSKKYRGPRLHMTDPVKKWEEVFDVEAETKLWLPPRNSTWNESLRFRDMETAR